MENIPKFLENYPNSNLERAQIFADSIFKIVWTKTACGKFQKSKISELNAKKNLCMVVEFIAHSIKQVLYY